MAGTDDGDRPDPSRARRPRTGAAAEVGTPKREVLDAADQAGAVLGSLFLFIASFSIVAGIMLLVNIFVMLADERQAQLGMLRAIGNAPAAGHRPGSRSKASVYTGLAAILGAALGVLHGTCGRRCRRTHPQRVRDRATSALSLVFAVTPRSVVNGVTAGFLISFLAVVLTSVRIARQNVIAAIRDLDVRPRPRQLRRSAVASAVATAVLAAVSRAGGRGGDERGADLPAAGADGVRRRAAAAHPLVRAGHVHAGGRGRARLGTAGEHRPAVHLRPGVDRDVHRPRLRAVLRRRRAGQREPGRAAAAAAPGREPAGRDRAGGPARGRLPDRAQVPDRRHARRCTAIVTLVIVLLIQISAIIDAGVADAVRKAAGTSTLRVDFSRNAPLADPAADLRRASGGAITDVTPLVTATADGADPLGRTGDPLPVLAIGVPASFTRGTPAVRNPLPSLATAGGRVGAGRAGPAVRPARHAVRLHRWPAGQGDRAGDGGAADRRPDRPGQPVRRRRAARRRHRVLRHRPGPATVAGHHERPRGDRGLRPGGRAGQRTGPHGSGHRPRRAARVAAGKPARERCGRHRPARARRGARTRPTGSCSASCRATSPWACWSASPASAC